MFQAVLSLEVKRHFKSDPADLSGSGRVSPPPSHFFVTVPSEVSASAAEWTAERMVTELALLFNACPLRHAPVPPLFMMAQFKHVGHSLPALRDLPRSFDGHVLF